MEIRSSLFNKSFHIIFEFRGKRDFGFARWVDEGDAGGMEELAGDSVGALGEGIFASVSVGIISEDGTSDRGEMDTDLVHPPRFEDTFDETIFLMNAGLENLIMCDGRLPTCLIDNDLVGVFGM